MLRVGGVHAGNVDQVRYDGTRGRFRPGARPVVQRGSDSVALDQHSVHRSFDVGDQALRRHQCRMNPELDAFAVRTTRDRSAPGDAEQLDPVSQLLGVAEVLAREPRDPFGVNLVELHRHPKGDG